MDQLDSDPNRQKTELKLKLEFLLYEQHPQRIVRERNKGLPVSSYPALAEAIEIGKKNHSQVHWREGRLSDRVTNLILKLYGIPQDDDCAQEFRRGYAKNFIREFRNLHPETEEPIRERAPTAIAAGPRQKPLESIPVGLVSVAIEGSQYGIGTVAVGITVACGLWQGATVKSGRIALECSPAAMTPDSFKGWVGKSQLVKTATVGGIEGKVSLAFGGTRLSPTWRVTAVGESIGTFWVDPGFAAIEDMMPGGKVTITFGTWLSEIEDAKNTPVCESLILVDDDGRELKIPAAELSERKRRVISNIRKAILDAGPDGYVDLASHTLVVIKRQS